ncbi:MAG: homoserine dehydrogenase [Actinomycetota bacterium]|jgi:homoserine dehydrogenase|nr:homoserine dehydrogenase [Actinomycetota bacterium]
MTGRRVRVGLLGCGTVGGATARILVEHVDEIARRAGAGVDLVRIAVRDLSKPRPIDLAPEAWTSDTLSVVDATDVDVVVETIGGIEPARELILKAFAAGKPVVTANKELLSTHGQEVMDAADAAEVDFLFEASVGGGIPIIRPLKESLAGDHVVRIMGILNGTTNFILTRMSETGVEFVDALAEAESLGYAEQDPSADIDGFDAAAKLAILSSIAFNARVVAGDVQREGISTVSARDIVAAHELGYEIKLLGVAESQGGTVSARVYPAMLPKTHPLAAVRDVFNAVFVQGEEAGELMFFGRGAGGGPTGSAVVGDVVEIARNLVTGGRAVGCTCDGSAKMRAAGEIPVRYYIVLSVADRPGVLSEVAGVFARHDVSIASVRQEGTADAATLVAITHTASEGQHQATFMELGDLEAVKSVDSTLRVEGTAE